MEQTIPLALACVLIIAVIALAIVATSAWLLWRRERKQKQEYQARYEELEWNIQSSEVKSFEYKLNPHLFKNTLNSIQSHAYQTYHALDKLANVLDYILYESAQQYVSLREEVEFALSLIEINRLKVSPLFDLRVQNRINTSEPLYEQKLVAPFITTHLIENAFKHADLQSSDSFISIVFEVKNNHFVLAVSNKISPKHGLKKAKSGFGQESFKKRLEVFYKEHFKLEQFIEEDVYIAHLSIDLVGNKDKVLAAGR